MKITPLEGWIAGKLRLTEPLTLPRLQDDQLNKLRDTLEYVAEHGRFYKEHLRGIDPASIRTMEDVARLPFTDPGILAERFHECLCVSPSDISRIVTLPTSGTNGRPKRIAFTPEDIELIVDFFHHGMTTLADSSDRVMIFLPGETPGSVGALLKEGLSRLGCESFVFGPVVDHGRALRALVEARATCAVGIPSQLLALSRYSDSGLLAEQIQLRSVLLCTDYVPQAVADSLTQTWKCEVYGHYGMTEMGLGGGVECSARNGYHMRDADLLFEIIDPVTGVTVKEGEYGEVVFSTLTRRGMPLIRYRTGDRSRILAQPCSCGSVLKRMERISGRMNGVVPLWGGSAVSITQLDEILLRDPCVVAYSAEVDVKDGCDCLFLVLQSTRQAVDAGKIALALGRHFPLGDLIRQGRLKLDIRVSDVGFFTDGTAKRSIADRRPHPARKS